MRKDAIFIAVEVSDAVASDPALGAKLDEVCPVDIYAQAPEQSIRMLREERFPNLRWHQWDAATSNAGPRNWAAMPPSSSLRTPAPS